MNLEKIKKQWDEYNEEFDSCDYMDIETHTSMALTVGELIDEIERLQELSENQRTELIERKKYEGFLRSVIRAGEKLKDEQDFKWFLGSVKTP